MTGQGDTADIEGTSAAGPHAGWRCSCAFYQHRITLCCRCMPCEPKRRAHEVSRETSRIGLEKKMRPRRGGVAAI